LIVPKLREYTLSFFSWVWSGIIWCWEALFSSYTLPGWILLIILVLALFGLIIIFISIKSNNNPEYKSYVEDFIYGVKWRWEWSGNNIFNTWCYCPKCDATLVYDDSSCSRYSSVSKTDFICENCNSQVVASISGGNKRYAIGAVEREIDRRIRTNEYKNTLTNHRS